MSGENHKDRMSGTAPQPKAEAFDYVSLQGGPNGLYLRVGQQPDAERSPLHVASLTCSPRTAELLHDLLGRWLDSYRSRYGPIPDPQANIVRAPGPLRPVS